MLIACQSCHRQFDVSDHEAGALVRCFCGVKIEVQQLLLPLLGQPGQHQRRIAEVSVTRVDGENDNLSRVVDACFDPDRRLGPLFVPCRNTEIIEFDEPAVSRDVDFETPDEVEQLPLDRGNIAKTELSSRICDPAFPDRYPQVEIATARQEAPSREFVQIGHA